MTCFVWKQNVILKDVIRKSKNKSLQFTDLLRDLLKSVIH